MQLFYVQLNELINYKTNEVEKSYIKFNLNKDNTSLLNVNFLNSMNDQKEDKNSPDQNNIGCTFFISERGGHILIDTLKKVYYSNSYEKYSIMLKSINIDDAKRKQEFKKLYTAGHVIYDYDLEQKKFIIIKK